MSGSFSHIVEKLEETKDDATYHMNDITSETALQQENARNFFLSRFRAVILDKAKIISFQESNQGYAHFPGETTCISAGKKYSFLSNDGSENSNSNKVAPATPPRSKIPEVKEPPATPSRHNPPVMKR
jgi:hypothetical protein